MSAKTRVHFLTFLMVFATFGIAFGLDRLILHFRQQLSLGRNPPLDMGSQMVIMSLANVVLAFCVFWLYNNTFPALRLAALWTVVGVGLLVSFIPVLYWIPIPGVDLSIFLSGRYYFISSGGLIAVAALFALYKMKKVSA